MVVWLKSRAHLFFFCFPCNSNSLYFVHVLKTTHFKADEFTIYCSPPSD